MAKNTPKEIEASEAIKAFKGLDVKVQVATPGPVKGADGTVREGYVTKTDTLAEAHITGARDYGDRVVVTTIDGQRHEAPKSAGKAAA